MHLGYIHTNREELTKVVQVLKLTSESVALDELGIGRLRDAFAYKMFPGISTLQKHMKYFSLMPQLYKKAAEKQYARISEVKAEIVRLERIMTRVLYENSEVKTGITGSDMILRNTNNYVKYDPAYIYNSGLQTFEILKSPQLYALIFSSSKAYHNDPQKLKSDDENVNDDANGYSGWFQFCAFPNVDYDFTKKCDLNLTPEDKEFIVDKISRAKACHGTLLKYIVEHPELTLYDKFPGIPPKELPQDLRRVQDLAHRFAVFIHVVHLRYNWICSKETDEEILDKFNKKLQVYRDSGTDINEVLNAVNITENSSKDFCRQVDEFIAKNDMAGLDECIVRREKMVKRSRRKIGNPSYTYDPKNPIHDYELSFRWEIVKLFMEELRGKEAANG
jgi:hypothetical protein